MGGWLSGWALALALLGCAPSFKAVAIVGAQGQKLTDHAPALETALLCDYGQALLPTNRANCEEWAGKHESRSAALMALASYGKALKQIAELEDPDTAEAADSMFSALDALEHVPALETSDADKGLLKGAFGGLVRFMSKAQRLHVLQEVVTSSNEPIQSLVGQLSGQFGLRLEYLEIVDEKLRGLLRAGPESGSDARLVICDAGAPAEGSSANAAAPARPACPPPLLLGNNSADRIAFAQARNTVRLAMAESVRAARDLDAFGKAHAKLRQSIDRIDEDDAEIAKAILEDVRAVYAITQLGKEEAVQ
jgi:hypothetical protein